MARLRRGRRRRASVPAVTAMAGEAWRSFCSYGVDMIARHEQARGAVVLGLVLALTSLGGGPAHADGPSGAAVFRTRCAPCHGETGRTDTPIARTLKVRPLAGDTHLAQMTVADLAHAIATNRKHASLRAIQDLDDEQRRAVAEHVKQLAGEP
jgi:mono/diheme cytochrome c family protein